MRSLFLIGLLVLTLVSAKPRQANEAKIVRRETCSQTYTGQSGVITSHRYYGRRNYDTDIDCRYTIITGSSATVFINIEDLDLERENTCSYDYLKLGLNTLKPKKLCGTQRGTFVYENVQGGLILEFISDYSITARGFKLSYNVFGGKNADPSWTYTTRSWRNNTTIPWNHTVPSWNHTIPSWNHTIPSWNYTIPSWNHTIPSWNYTTASWNNTSSNQTYF